MNTEKDILDLRIDHGWTLAEVESCTGVRVSSLSRIENGEQVPRPDTARKLAKHYKISPGDLYGAVLLRQERIAAAALRPVPAA